MQPSLLSGESMFNLTPISTSDLIFLLQVLVVSAGFYFSWRSLEAAIQTLNLGTRNAQAQLFNQIVLQGRDLNYKFMDIFLSGNGVEELREKQKLYTGTVIAYYASCYELKKVLALPPHVEKLLDAELRELMREKQIRDKWDEVKHLYSQDFLLYVESVRGIK
jgi:hypothetical protein